MTLPASARRYFFFAIGLFLIAVLFSGCGAIDPEYTRELTSARTNCKRNDIVGLWVSQITGNQATGRITLQIAPDGTGLFRMKIVEGTPANGMPVMEASLRWTYAGGGIWTSDVQFSNKPVPEKATFQYTGRKLLFKEGLIASACCVCVRADDARAVEAHLQERRNVKPLFPVQPTYQPQPMY